MKTIFSKIAEPDSVILLVGPEGDFSPNEYEEIQSKDFLPVSLGGLTLRVETAILTMISSVRYQFSC
jgi:16S rRNA (uracil1498-N3)-methyltransferase